MSKGMEKNVISKNDYIEIKRAGAKSIRFYAYTASCGHIKNGMLIEEFNDFSQFFCGGVASKHSILRLHKFLGKWLNVAKVKTT